MTAPILGTQIRLKASWTLQQQLSLGNVLDNNSLQYALDMATGVGASQNDTLWGDVRPSLAAGGNDDLDLTALTHTYFNGTLTYTFAKVKGILVLNNGGSGASGEDLLIGAAGSNPFQGPFSAGANTVRVGAGGAFMALQPVNGWAVNSGSKILRIHNSGAAANVPTVLLWGTSS